MIGMALLFLANSIFQGTNEGMEKTFIGSFTGNAAIGSGESGNFSLFGNIVPIVSEYEAIPPLFTHSDITGQLESVPEVEAWSSIVSVPSQLSMGRRLKKNVALFGIDPETYFDVCTDIEIVSGDTSGLASNGVFINSVLADELQTALGRDLVEGEMISFTLYSGSSFRIRSAPFLGIHRYSGTTDALDRVVLADLTTTRSLADYTLGYSFGSDGEEEEPEADNFSFDDLFSVDNDVFADESEGVDLGALEEDIADTSERDSLVLTDSGAWSFILIKAAEGESKALFRSLKAVFSDPDFDARLLSWRDAAGSSALILLAIQSLFYLGLGFLGLGAVLVIMNALVFSVLERAGEIGTMRSIGASPGFIRQLFMVESLIITVGGGIVGIMLGAVGAFTLKISELQLGNELLSSLFGGSTLNPVITFSNILLHLLIALFIGSLAWIYPVSVAVRIQPVSAMNRG